MMIHTGNILEYSEQAQLRSTPILSGFLVFNLTQILVASLVTDPGHKWTTGDVE